jgi:hypothetical protein
MISDAVEALGQHVNEVAPDELVSCEAAFSKAFKQRNHHGKPHPTLDFAVRFFKRAALGRPPSKYRLRR